MNVGFSNGQLALGMATVSLANVHNPSLSLGTTSGGDLVISFDGPPIILSTDSAVPLNEIF